MRWVTRMCWAWIPTLALLASVAPAHADWVSYSGAENAPNIAEIRIAEDGVRIQLEIFVGDLAVFERLVPDSLLEGMDVERPDLEERLRRFAQEDFQVLANGTTPLSARVLVAEPRLRVERYSPLAGQPNPLTGQRIPGPPDDKRVLYVELLYPFEGRPSSLVFMPPATEGMLRATIGFVAYHNQVPVSDFKYLQARTALRLDWNDPWYSTFDNPNLKRWQRGPVQSFLYIEPLEVRHEVLARVRNLEAWMDLGLRGRGYVELDENEPLKQRIGAFFLEREEVTIDGVTLEPILDRVSFVKYAMTGSTFVDQPERLPLDTATVGVIITYLTNGLPQEVRSRWSLWSDRVQEVPTDCIDPAGGLPYTITPDDDVQVWENFLKTFEPPRVVRFDVDPDRLSLSLPLASVLLLAALLLVLGRALRRRRQGERVGSLLAMAALLAVGAVLLRGVLPASIPRPSVLVERLRDEEAVAVLDDLLRNTYRAFDFRDEGDVYGKLSMSVEGDLLSDIYLMNRRSLAVARAGGAQARVQAVEIRDAKVEHLDDPRLAMRFRATWTAAGSVNHWGHVHSRVNLYEADVTVAPVDGAWKITDLEVLDEKRL